MTRDFRLRLAALAAVLLVGLPPAASAEALQPIRRSSRASPTSRER